MDYAVNKYFASHYIAGVVHFDNSPKNNYNPDPPSAVRFGGPTYDEMMIAFAEYTLDCEHSGKPYAARASK